MANYKEEDWLVNVPLYMLSEYLLHRDVFLDGINRKNAELVAERAGIRDRRDADVLG